MTEKNEALRLARELEACPTINYKAHATELRRLSAVEADFHMAYRMKCDAQTKVLHAQRDALLEALRALVHEGRENYVALDRGIGTETAAGQRWLNARAAIKAVEEGK